MQINLLPTHPTPNRSLRLRGLGESSAIALSQWDEVAGRATLTVTAPSRPRHFTQLPSPCLIQSLEGESTDPCMPKHTSTASELSRHSLLWRDKPLQGKERRQSPNTDTSILPPSTFTFMHRYHLQKGLGAPPIAEITQYTTC